MAASALAVSQGHNVKWTAGDMRTKTRFQMSGRLSEELQSQRRARRCTEVLHRFCNQPLPWYKVLEPSRPEWPNAWRWYHPKDGIRVLDEDTIVVSAKDRRVRTKAGLLPKSSGHVTYSASDRMRFELDAEDLATILRDSHCYNSKIWTIPKLEKTFKYKLGRSGSWKSVGLELDAFLSLFPRTFEVFGASDFVRVLHSTTRATNRVLVDDGQDVMVRLALACSSGYIAPEKHVEGADVHEAPRHPLLGAVGAKARFKSHARREHRSERIQDEAATVKLPLVQSSPLLPMMSSLTLGTEASRAQLPTSQSTSALHAATRHVEELD
eukprot:TRINITY_DN31686_c0_g1_i1.p1 TRINITY_DN31686_c0_g1~~TRINITY_DN31686_c0_g1_i1.p1  ORF type:complete len:325 (-),score=33.89 TRINITY_DN31686_c0_g1_i1:141-1115(-)